MKGILRKVLAWTMTILMLLTSMPLGALAEVLYVENTGSIQPFSILKPDQTPYATYVFKDGSATLSTQIVKTGDELYRPEVPEKEGFKFVGWYVANEDGSASSTQFTSFGVQTVDATAEITLVAVWAEAYYVFFHDHNNRVVHTVETKNGATVAADYTFESGADTGIEGWYTSKAGDTFTGKVTEVKINGADVHLYAKVVPGHWLHFDSQGGSILPSKFYLTNEQVAAADEPTPTRDGYTFGGWYTVAYADNETNVDSSKKFSFSGALSATQTLYARWIAKDVDYTIIYWIENANDSNYTYYDTTTGKGKTGATTTAGALAKMEGGFELVTKNGELVVPKVIDAAQPSVQQTIAGDGSTIVNVYYSRIEYEMKFWVRGDGSSTPTCGKEEHTHKEWKATWDTGCYSTKICKHYTSIICTEDCYSKTPSCGKEAHKHSDACYKEGDTEVETVNGWYTWKKIKAKYGADITWPGGVWYTGPKSDVMQSYAEVMPLGGYNYYWRDENKKPGSQYEGGSAEYYLQSLPDESGNVSYVYKHTDRASSENPSITIEDFYGIKGFTQNYLVNGGGTKYEYSKLQKGNRYGSYNGSKFYYTRNTYTITYYVDGQLYNEPVGYLYEASIPASAGNNPVRPANVPASYVFSGWCSDPACQGGKYVFPKTMPAENLVVYGKWEPVQHEVKVVADTVVSVEGKEFTVISGEVIDQTKMPEYKLDTAKYEWQGWATKNANGEYTIWDMSQAVTSDLTLYPYYTSKAAFGVTYDTTTNGGSGTVTDSKQYKEGTYADIALDSNVTAPAGKVFLYWNTKADGTGDTYYPRDKMYMPGKSVTLYAIYGDQPKLVNVTYHSNFGTDVPVIDGQVVNNGKVTVKGYKNIPGMPERAGYTFAGWATSASATVAAFNAGDEVRVDNKGSNDLWAVWTAIVGDVKITKVVQGIPDDVNNDSFTFTISGTSTAGDSINIESTALKDGGSYTFDDVPAGTYKISESINYAALEDVNRRYTTTIGGTAIASYNLVVTADGANVTVVNTATDTYKNPLTGTKTWNDGSNATGQRPEKITVNLLADGTKKTSKEVTGTSTGNTWTYSFANMPVYKDGVKINYTVSEEAVPNYTASYNDMNITNSIQTGTLKIVKKVTGLPTGEPNSDEFTFTVKGSGTYSKTSSAIKAGEIATITNVPAGFYTVSENDNSSWTHTYNKAANQSNVVVNAGATTTITMTNAVRDVVDSVIVEKVWDDASNQDGKRPSSLTIYLAGPNDNYKYVATLNAANAVAGDANTWRTTISNVRKYTDGENSQKISYNVTESYPNSKGEYIEDSAIFVAADDADHKVTLTNKHTPSTIPISGSKTWDDAEDQDGKRPDFITIHLWANGTEVKSKTVSAADEWKWSFADMPEYANGSRINYTITEDQVEDYTSEVSGYNVTNVHTPAKTSVTVTKAWKDANDQDGLRPDSVIMQLKANGENCGVPVEVTGSYTWSDLDAYANGRPIIYTVAETAVDGYTTDYDDVTGDIESGYAVTVTNSHTPATTNITITKTWADDSNRDGLRKPVTINLMADGKMVESWNITADQLTNNNLSTTFTGLPVYRDGGVKIVYTADEVDSTIPTGYTEDGVTTDLNVTNTHTPETITISGTKFWTDTVKSNANRPAVTIVLKADGIRIKSATVNAASDWKYSFTDLPKFLTGAVGKEIVYTVEEKVVPGYTTTQTGTNFSNSRDTASLKVEKIWNTTEDRKDAVTLQVYRRTNGTARELYETVVLSAPQWSTTLPNVPTHDELGNQYTYSVVETMVGTTAVVDDKANVNNVTIYTVSPTPSAGVQLTRGQTYELKVTNTLEQAKLEINGTKTWVVPESYVAPTNATIKLYRRVKGTEAWGEAFATTTTDASGAYKFSNLDKYTAAKTAEYEYKVEEVVPANFTAVYSADNAPVVFNGDAKTSTVNIKNALNTETIDLPVTKQWIDSATNAKRTDVDIRLRKKIGAAFSNTDRVITISDPNASRFESEWTGSFNDLPKYAWVDGEGNEVTTAAEAVNMVEITYGVYEITDLDDYEHVVRTDDDHTDGLKVINKLKEGSKNITLNKTWNAPAYVRNDAQATFTLQRKREGMEEEYTAVVIDRLANPVTLKRSEDQPVDITWSNLPVYSPDGYTYLYRVVESGLTDGWSASNTVISAEDSLDLTASNTIDQNTAIKVTKIADDTELLAKTDKFVFGLYYLNGATKTLVEQFALANGETKTFTNLAYGNYTVEEIFNGAAADAWTVEQTNTTDNGICHVTFTNIRKTTSIDVNKTWYDDPGFANLRPNVTFELYWNVEGGEEKLLASKTMDNDAFSTENRASETIRFTDLPTYTVNGEEIIYTVKEVTSGGVAAYTSTKYENSTFTNTSNGNNDSIDVTKVWDLNGIELKKYPTITMGLFYGKDDASSLTEVTKWNGSAYAPVQMTLENGATAVSFDNLPVLANGYSYFVKEVAMTGNVTFVSGEKTVTMEGTKFFDFATAKNQVAANGGTITNTANYGAFKVKKTVKLADSVWPANAEMAFEFGGSWVTVDGTVKPAKLTLKPTATAPAVSEQIVVKLNTEATITETAQAGWTADRASANVIVDASDAAANTVEVVEFTNTRKTEQVSVNKTWNDSNNKYGERPSLQYVLYGTVEGEEGEEGKLYVKADGTTTATKTAFDSSVTFAANTTNTTNFAHTYANLPQYTADNQEITWSVEEVVGASALAYVSGATTIGEPGGAFVNSVQDGDNGVTIKATKVWDRNGVELVSYPTATFQVFYGKDETSAKALTDNGEPFTAELNGTTTSRTFTNLPVLADGYNYYIKETKLEGGSLYYDGENTTAADKLFDFYTNAAFDAMVQVANGEASITNTIEGFRAYTITKTINLNNTAWSGDAQEFTFDAMAIAPATLKDAKIEITLAPTASATTKQIVVTKDASVIVSETNIPAGWELTNGNNKAVTLSDSEAANVAFSNQRKITNIEGSKTWSVNDEAKIKDKIKLVITRRLGETTEEFTETVAIKDGKFTVDTIGGNKMPAYSEDNQAYTYAIKAEIVPNGFTADYANNKTSITNIENATLTINKVAGADVKQGDTAAFTFAVTTENGELIVQPENNTVAFGESDTYTVKGNRAYTITESVKTGYYLTDVALTIDGVKTDIAKAMANTVAIGAGKKVVITYTNNAQEGSFTLTKVGAGNVKLAGAEFTLYAAGESDTVADAVVDGNIFTKATTNANGEVTFSELPIGTYFAVETKAADGYVLPKNDYIYRKVVVSGNATNTAEADVRVEEGTTVTNTLDGATSFTLTKLVNEGAFDTTDAAFGFTIQLSNSKHRTYTVTMGGKPYSTTDGNITIPAADVQLENNDYVLVEGMPHDTTISVTEVLTEAQKNAWTTAWSNGTTGVSANVTVNAQNRAVALTATNTRVAYDLSAKKVWNDQSNHFALRPTTPVSYTLYRVVEINGEKTTEAINTVTLTADTTVDTAANKQDIKTWTNLPAYDEAGNAYSYYVTETVPDRYEANNNGEANAITLSASGAITIENVLKVTENNFTVTKTWVENPTIQEDLRAAVLAKIKSVRPTLTFDLTNRDITTLAERATLTKNVETVDFDRKMPVSKAYALVETIGNDGGGFKYTAAEPVAVRDTDGNITGFNVTNTLDLMTITLTKKWDDNGITGMKHPTASFELYYTDADNNKITVATTSTPDGAADDGNNDVDTYTFANVPARDDYKIVETALSDTTYFAVNTTAVEVKNNKAEITNECKYGALEITKVVNLGSTEWANEDSDPTFKFEFSTNDGATWTDIASGPSLAAKPAGILIVPDQDMRNTYPQLIFPVGTKVMVREVLGENNTEWNLNAIASNDGSAQTISADAVTKVKFQNDRDIQPITVNKTWNDKSGDPARRPDSVTFGLFYRNADGSKGSAVLKDGKAWTETITTDNAVTRQSVDFENVPVNAEGYIVEETMDAATNEGAYVAVSYTVSLNAADTVAEFTNYPTKAVVTVKKAIVDNTLDAANGMAASFAFAVEGVEDASKTIGHNGSFSFEVEIGKQYKLVETVDSDTWDASFTGATETAINGTATFKVPDDKAVHEIVVTNTRKAIELTLDKTWVDNNNKAGTRPATIDLIVETKTGDAYAALKVGAATVGVNGVAASQLNDYTFSAFNGKTLPAADVDGNVIAYRLNEVATAEDGTIIGQNGAFYNATITADSNYTTAITNALVTGTTSISFTKTWVDNNNEQRIRPAASAEGFGAWLTLYQSTDGANWTRITGTPSVAVVDNGDNTYTITYSNLDRFDPTGTEYQYAATETIPDAFGDYKQSDADTLAVGNNGNITNQLKDETVTVTLTKHWHDGNGNTLETEIIPVSTLYAAITRYTTKNGEDSGLQLAQHVTITPDADGAWTVSATLPKYDDDGALYKYGAVEYQNEAMYNADVSAGTVANYVSDSTTTFGGKTYSVTYGGSDNNFTITNELKQYDLTIVKAIDWQNTVKENTSFDIEFSYKLPGAAATTGKVTAAYDAETDSISYTTTIGETTTRGNVLSLPYGTEVTVTEEPTAAWTKAIAGLDEGKAFITIDKAAGEQVTVTNTRVRTTLDFTKTWVDASNALVTRPETIKVEPQVKSGNSFILAPDAVQNQHVSEILAVKTAEDSTKYTGLFADSYLPKFAVDGTKLEYRVAEVNDIITGVKADYTTKVDGAIVTNTIKQELVSISGTKTWNLIKGEVAPEVTFELYRDDETTPIETVTVATKASAAATTYTFDALEKYAVAGIAAHDSAYTGALDGHIFTYTVKEVFVPGYSVDNGSEVVKLTKSSNTYTGADFTNTADEITVEVTKEWLNGEGNPLDEALIPAELVVTLQRNGKAYKEIAMNAADHRTAESTWAYTFETLPIYDENGEAYIYTVVETDPSTEADTFTELTVENAEISLKDGKWLLQNEKNSLPAVPPTKDVTEIESTYLEGTTEQVIVGSEITYTIGWTNTTNTRQVITIVDELEDYVAYASHTASEGEKDVAVVSGANNLFGGYYDAASHTVTWKFEAKPFSEGSVSVTVEVLEAALEGAEPNPQVSNSATVKIGGADTETAPADDITVYNPVLTLDKASDTSKTYALGDDVEYTITIKNEGNVTLSDIDVTDVIDLDPAPAYELAMDAAASTEGMTFADGVIATMAPGDVVVITYSFEVTEEVILAADETDNKVVNLAKVDADDPSGDDETYPLNPEDEVILDVDAPKPVITIDKVTTSKPADGVAYVLGETIEYAITVKNEGNLTISEIVVEDLLADAKFVVEEIEGVSYSEDLTTAYIDELLPTVSGRDTVVLHAQYTVQESDLYVGEVTNDVTVVGKNEDPKNPEDEDNGSVTDVVEEINPSYAIVKELDNEPKYNGAYELGEKVLFKITVTNDGNLTLSNLVVDEVLAGATFVFEEIEGVSYSEDKTTATIETLVPAASGNNEIVLHAEYTVKEADLGQETLINEVALNGTYKDAEGEDTAQPEESGDAEFPVDDATFVNVEKIWDDQENIFNTRRSFTVNLYQSVVAQAADEAEGEAPAAEPYKTATLTADENGNYSHSFTQLPMHKDGNAVEYSVEEVEIRDENGMLIYAPTYEVAGDETGKTVTITNTLQQYTLTIRYWYNRINGSKAAETFTRAYYYGESHSVTSPRITGYSVDKKVVSGIITGDVEYDVIYTPIDYRLTVYYVYEDGTTAASTYGDILNIYDEYYVGSPVIEGYVASSQLVSGTMPGHDVVYTVIYVPETVTIEEYGVPLNLGNVVMNVGDCFE